MSVANGNSLHSLVGLSGFRCIVADPPWPQPMTGSWKREPKRAKRLPYPTMSMDEIKELPVGGMAEPDAHLWLWTTNAFLEDGFAVLRRGGSDISRRSTG